jgi:hypothetical protein
MHSPLGSSMLWADARAATCRGPLRWGACRPGGWCGGARVSVPRADMLGVAMLRARVLLPCTGCGAMLATRNHAGTQWQWWMVNVTRSRATRTAAVSDGPSLHVT